MYTLTTDQKQQLLEILIEEFGAEMGFENFTEALLGLLEDIAGFETAPPVVIDEIVQHLWSQYHD